MICTVRPCWAPRLLNLLTEKPAVPGEFVTILQVPSLGLTMTGIVQTWSSPTVVGFDLCKNIWDLKQNGRRITKSHGVWNEANYPIHQYFFGLLVWAPATFGLFPRASRPWTWLHLVMTIGNEPLKQPNHFSSACIIFSLCVLRSHRNSCKCPFPFSLCYPIASYMSTGDVKRLSQFR